MIAHAVEVAERGYFGAALTLLVAAVVLSVPVIAVSRRPRGTRWLAVGACVLVATVSAIRFTSTPDGVLQDTLEYAGAWQDRIPGERATWDHFFAHIASVKAVGWNAFLVGFARQLSGTWLVERILGLAWHLSLTCALVAWPFTALAGVPVTVAVLSATRAGLWLQRHHSGSELLLAQALLVAALWRARTSRTAAVLGGVLTAFALYNYLAAMVWLAYPAIVCRHAVRRLMLVYGVALVVAIPALWTFDGEAIFARGANTAGWTWPYLWARTWTAARGFWIADASRELSWLWSYPGAQHLPAIACVCVVVGALVAIRSAGGRTWLVLAGIGLLPAVMSDGPAASHRVMMSLLPLAVLAGHCGRLVPRRARWPLGILLALWVTVAGCREWLDPQFWEYWRGGGYHGFVEITR